MPSATAPTLMAGDVLTLSELRHFERVSGLRSAALVAHAWLTIAAAMIVYALWPSAVTLVAAIAVIGARQFGLVVLMHEATLLVFVPCWKLRAAHALLLAKGYGPRMEIAPSYAHVIRRVTSAR